MKKKSKINNAFPREAVASALSALGPSHQFKEDELVEALDVFTGLYIASIQARVTVFRQREINGKLTSIKRIALNLDSVLESASKEGPIAKALSYDERAFNISAELKWLVDHIDRAIKSQTQYTSRKVSRTSSRNLALTLAYQHIATLYAQAQPTAPKVSALRRPYKHSVTGEWCGELLDFFEACISPIDSRKSRSAIAKSIHRFVFVHMKTPRN